MARSVEDTPELRRVLDSPRREKAPDLSSEFRKNKNVAMFGIQSQLVHDVTAHGGAIGDIDVGHGKTLALFLLPVAMGITNSVLLIPGGEDMRAKTEREFYEYSRNWHIRMPTLVSYKKIGMEKYNGLLNELKPKAIFADEAHKLRNRDASCTRRVARYLSENEDVPFVPVSANICGTRLTHVHHLLRWSVGPNSMALPAPLEECEKWSLAADGADRYSTAMGMGALDLLPGGPWQWMLGSRGVVVSEQEGSCDAEINVSTWKPDCPPELRRVIERVIETGHRPDGEELEDSEISVCLSTLELGFFHVWEPEGPTPWMQARSVWFKEARGWLSQHLDGLDSKGQLELAMTSGRLPMSPNLQRWIDQRDSFTPNTKAIWVTHDVMKQVASHVGPNTLIWSKWDAPGELLGRYFGGGSDPRGCGLSTIALSQQAHGEGKNLQHEWVHHFFLFVPGSEEIVQQCIGRTHRTHQTASHMDVVFLALTGHNVKKIKKLRALSHIAKEKKQKERKLTIANWI